MKAHMDRARAHLGDLGALAAKTAAAERNILAGAEQRLEAVQAEIEKARPGVEATDDAGQQRYLDLVAERGQLHQVIAKARQALA